MASKWKINNNGDGTSCINAGNGEDICHTCAASDEPAKAKLIATAPELLCSLQEMVADLISHAKFGMNETEVDMLKKAEAAIAEATGTT